MQQGTPYLLGLSAVALLAGAYLGAFAPDADARVVSMITSMGTAILVIAIVRETMHRKCEVEQDERTRKVNRLAGSCPWWASYALIALLMLIVEFGVAAIPAEGALGVVFFFMVFSQAAFRSYFNSKGNIE